MLVKKRRSILAIQQQQQQQQTNKQTKNAATIDNLPSPDIPTIVVVMNRYWGPDGWRYKISNKSMSSAPKSAINNKSALDFPEEMSQNIWNNSASSYNDVPCSLLGNLIK